MSKGGHERFAQFGQDALGRRFILVEVEAVHGFGLRLAYPKRITHGLSECFAGTRRAF
jgi:hypothetical protein